MALTASALISAAKKRTFGVTGRQKVSDAMLLEELSAQDSQIVQMLSQTAPDLLATVTGSDVVTLAENQSGYTLANGIHYRDFTHVADDVYTPINIVQRQYQHNTLRHPCGMLRTGAAAGVFYPVDPDGNRWQESGSRPWFEAGDGHEFRYSYVVQPAVLSTLSATLTSPDMARDLLVAALEVAILLSAPGVQEARLQVAVAKHQSALQSLQFQAYKFGHPQGSHGSALGPTSEAAWVAEHIGD